MSSALRAAWRRLVEGRWAQNMANNVGVPSERRLQEGLDMERLLPCTLLWELVQNSKVQPSPQDYRRIAMLAKSMGSRKQRESVEGCVARQILGTATALHEELTQAGDATHAAQAMAAAYERLIKEEDDDSDGDDDKHPSSDTLKAGNSSDAHSAAQMTVQDVSKLLKARLGFSTTVGPSSIQHPEAGLGVFIQGDACVGSVVALVPGLVYTRTQLPRMPNYPQVSLGNPYLSSRYDSTIIDSKPWQPQSTDGATQLGEVSSQGSSPATSVYARWALSGVEQRHPLAVGHLINHPPPGSQPNVLEVGWDIELDLAAHPVWLRAYIPVVPGLDLDQRDSEDASLALLKDGKRQKQRHIVTVRGLALVALRNIRDGEELWQNYRLNPRAVRPSWYTSIDPEEEKRRWAPLWYAKLL